MHRFAASLALFTFLTASAHADKLVLVAGGAKTEVGIPATEAKLRMPFGVDFDKAGNLYLVEFKGHRVCKVDAKGILTTIAGNGSEGFAGDGGPAAKAQFNGMHDLLIAPNDDIYIADSYNYRLRKIDAATGMISTVAGNGEKKYSGDGGPATKAGIDGIGCLALDAPAGKLYFTGFSKYVRILDLKTGTISSVSNFPGGRAVALDSKGNLYVVDGNILRVRDASGKVRTLLGKSAGLKTPKHICIDKDDNVILADMGNNQVRKYLVKEDKLVLLAGTGTAGKGGIPGPPLKAELSHPHGVTLRGGILYISDSYNHRILKVEP